MIHQVLGVIGVLMLLSAYFLLVTERMRAQEPAYIALNILGSALILVSLAYDFNLAATLMQACWIAVTLVGALLHRRHRKPQ
ncbi:MAG: CBU_0592 family membrane protein [Gammaproteobacteria bacterium]